MFNLLLTVFVCCLIVENDGAKILGVFPVPSTSHQRVFRPIMHELAKRGHEVVVITPNPAFLLEKPYENLIEIDVHDVSYKFWNKSLALATKGKERGYFSQMKASLEYVVDVFDAQVNSADVQKLINDKNRKFDLIFVESCVRPALAFSYLYKAPVIEFSSFGGMLETFDGVGAASHRLFYPLFSRQRINNLTLWEKISELYTQFLIEYAYKSLEETENKLLKKVFGPKIPNLNELRKNVQMVFLNVHPLWDFNRPVPPNVIYLGGIHQNPEKELPKDLESYLDDSKNGVIYMSFGTNIKPSLLPPEKIQIFTNIFSQLSYDVLWKWDKDELPGRPKNVRISKSFPQSDLLRHPNIKLFITQAGLHSTDESLTAGVPLIAIPMHGDQWFNAEQYVLHGIGIKLSMETITETILKDAIETVIGDKRYRENVVKLKERMCDQQWSPLERAVWWTEHVLRYGGAKHLRTAAADIYWTEYYMLDVVLPIFAVLLLLVLATLFLVNRLIRLVSLKCKQMCFKVKRS